MYQISFSPIRFDTPLTLSVDGEALIVNGDRLDFSAIATASKGEVEAFDCPFLADDPERDADGTLHVKVLLPYGSAASQDALFPQPIMVSEDGPVTLPAFGG